MGYPKNPIIPAEYPYRCIACLKTGLGVTNLDQLKRLSMRGFVTQNAGKISVTMKGRLALVVRRFIFG
jgi:hypothetical protein